MPSVIRSSLIIALMFMVFELAVRWIIRALIEPGSTVHLFANLYLANVRNVNSEMALGMGSVAWLMIAIVVTLLFFVSGFVALQFMELTKNDVFAKIGCVSSFIVLSVAVANLLEAIFLGGVTDYLAFVDLAQGRAKVINIGDIALTLGLAGIVVSAIGLAASLVARASRAAG